jgi:hypothetical protein
MVGKKEEHFIMKEQHVPRVGQNQDRLENQEQGSTLMESRLILWVDRITQELRSPVNKSWKLFKERSDMI